MKDILKIALGFVICVSIALSITCSLAPTLINHIEVSDVAENRRAYINLRFARRYQTYTKAPVTDKRIVVVGACQISDGQYSPPFQNLGFGGARIEEAANIIKYFCNRGDRVAYCFSLSELCASNENLRIETLSPILNELFICKAVARTILFRPKLRGPRNESVKPDKDTQDLLRHFPATKFPNIHPKMLLRNLEIASLVNTDSLSLARLLAMRREHSNIIFIVNPTLSLQPVPSDCKVARHINHYIHLRKTFLTKIAASGLPVIDLSDALDPAMFRDWHHLTPEGMNVLRDQISELSQPA